MKALYSLVGLLLILLVGISTTIKTEIIIDEKDSVADVMRKLGKSDDSKYPNKNVKGGVSAEAGRLLIQEGFAPKEKGGKTKKQSKHFVCTSCHNIVKEDIDLASPDPQERLIYSEEQGIPFLQGTTLYGAVNRETFYNGDYEKKYGALVEPARNDIREAIKLCAVECAQGRELDDWELESILAYLWTIDLKMGDLLLNGEEFDLVESALNTGEDQEDALAIVESKFAKGAEAHFVYPPEDRKKGYDYVGNPENGKMIYDNSCLHCHKRQRYSYFDLDNSKLSFKYLKGKANGYAPHSLYQVIRWGVPTKSGKKSYMPQYTKEKMSDQMVEDLRAYIEKRAE